MRSGCINLGWVEGLPGHDKRIQYAKNKMRYPRPANVFFVTTVMSFLCLLIHMCIEIMERVLQGYLRSKTAQAIRMPVVTGESGLLDHVFFLCLKLWSMRLCGVVFLRHAKECIWAYSVISSVISLLISESLEFDIQNSVLVVGKNTCRRDGVARCPWWLRWELLVQGTPAELPWGSRWNM